MYIYYIIKYKYVCNYVPPTREKKLPNNPRDKISISKFPKKRFTRQCGACNCNILYINCFNTYGCLECLLVTNQELSKCFSPVTISNVCKLYVIIELLYRF